MTGKRGEGWPLAILSVTPLPDGAEALVDAAPDAMRTSLVPGFSARLLRKLPGLLTHQCDNPDALSFADELRDTETAHALEHVALQLLRAQGAPGVRGETRWDFRADGRGRFRVAVLGVEAERAERALREAEELLRAAAI